MNYEFVTFDGKDAAELNNQIKGHCEDYYLCEIDRSAPSALYVDGIFHIYVTSRFLPLTEQEIAEKKKSRQSAFSLDEALCK